MTPMRAVLFSVPTFGYGKEVIVVYAEEVVSTMSNHRTAEVCSSLDPGTILRSGRGMTR